MEKVLNYSSMIRVRNAIIDDPAFYTNDEEYLVRLFLKHFTESDVFSMTLGELTRLFSGRIYKTVVTENQFKIRELSYAKISEGEFVQEVLRIYLNLSSAPQRYIKDIYVELSGILCDIDVRIKSFNHEIVEIDNRTQKHNEQEGDYRRKELLDFFIKKNESAKRQVVDFFCYAVKREALYRARDKSLELKWIDSEPLSARWSSLDYDPKYVTSTANKFGHECDLEEILDLERLRTEQPAEYSLFLQNYIVKHAIVQEIRDLLCKHHRLHARREILDEALIAYTNGHYRMFASIIPMQIEGIFHDWCLETKINKSQTKQPRRRLVESIAQINQFQEGFFFGFEYYSYIFPELRNKIAHGSELRGDIRILADEFLLDLRDVCLRISSDQLPVNLAVKIIRELDIHRNSWRGLFKFALIQTVELPSFYQLDGLAKVYATAISADDFMKKLLSVAEKGEPLIIEGLSRIKRTIPKSDIGKSLFNYLRDKKPMVPEPPLRRIMAAIDSLPEPS